MTKTYFGTNKELIKVWGIPFKEGTITRVIFHDEPYTRTYQDSLSGGLYGEIWQCQSMTIYTNTDKSPYSIGAPQWGYPHNASKEYKKMQNDNFKRDCELVLKSMGIK